MDRRTPREWMESTLKDLEKKKEARRIGKSAAIGHGIDNRIKTQRRLRKK